MFHKDHTPLFGILIGYIVAAAILYGVALMTGSIIVDGFQSLGAVATTDTMGDLHWPLVGSYLGYDQVWGFHWPGWPLLRSLLSPGMLWSPTGDLLLLALLWALAACQVFCLLRPRVGERWAMAGSVLTMFAPGILVTLQNYRPEVITALLILTALRTWDSKSKTASILLCVCLIALPAMHPLGSAVPGAWLAWAALIHLRGGGFFATFRALWLPSTTLFLGALGLLAWFGLQEQAWQQFQCNLQAQRLLGEGLKTNHLTNFRWLFGSLGALPLILLLLGGMAMACPCLMRAWRSAPAEANHQKIPASLILAAVGLVAGFLFNWILKNPNANHLTAITPLAVILVVILLQKSSKRWGKVLPALAYLSLLILSNALLVKYAWAMTKNGGRSYRAAIHNSITSLPATRKVWIPVAFWESAVIESRKGATSYQFSTFPNVLASAKRREYEQMVLQDLQPGDLLLWDPLQERGGVFNFVTETALRHLLILPEQQPEQWEKLRDIQIPVQYSRGQATDFVLYRKL